MLFLSYLRRSLVKLLGITAFLVSFDLYLKILSRSQKNMKKFVDSKFVKTCGELIRNHDWPYQLKCPKGDNLRELYLSQPSK